MGPQPGKALEPIVVRGYQRRGGAHPLKSSRATIVARALSVANAMLSQICGSLSGQCGNGRLPRVGRRSTICRLPDIAKTQQIKRLKLETKTFLSRKGLVMG